MRKYITMTFILPDDLMGLLLTYVGSDEHKILATDQLHLLIPSYEYISQHLTEYAVDQITIILKDKRIDPSINNNYAIRWATKNGYADVVRLLLADERVYLSITTEQYLYAYSLMHV